MVADIKNFKQDELAALKLRNLFEQSGFLRMRVNKFEDYALYMDHKSFLISENIISFMDVSGRLLALKPDVTLSVIKNMPQQPMPAFEKIYYIDEVCRLSKDNREYKVHSQIGVEIVGQNDSFVNIEVIQLALQALACIDENFVLDISNLSFVSGLLDFAGLSGAIATEIIGAIHSKSPHDVTRILQNTDVSSDNTQRIVSLCQLHGDFFTALPIAKSLIVNSQMQAGYDELERIANTVEGSPYFKNIQLDFSVINDLDYYSGLIFLGYVQGISSVVLSGGRYDHLMKKLGKQNGAIGFAVSLDLLSGHYKTGEKYDFDIMLTYSDDCDYKALLGQMQMLIAQGKSVRLERECSLPSDFAFTFAKHIKFRKNGVLEEGK